MANIPYFSGKVLHETATQMLTIGEVRKYGERIKQDNDR